MKRITINDIARLASVSKSTVSEVINNNSSGKVRESTFAKVQSIIKKYNYTPSMQARALTTRRTGQIGFLVSSTATLELANNYFDMILSGVEHQCSEQGYRCMVSRYDLSILDHFVLSQKVQERSIDGLIIAGLKNDPGHILDHLDIPILMIGSSSNSHIFQLHSDLFQTVVNAVEYLRNLGHRHFLLPYTFPQELELLVEVFNHCNHGNTCSSSSYLTGHYYSNCQTFNEFINGHQLAETALNRADLTSCTALIANDQVCSAFMQKLHECGYVLPKDYSILATNDSTLMKWGMVPVTVCDNNAFAMGQHASESIISLLKKKLSESELREKLATQNTASPLLHRSSCTAPRSHKLNQSSPKK